MVQWWYSSGDDAGGIDAIESMVSTASLIMTLGRLRGVAFPTGGSTTPKPFAGPGDLEGQTPLHIRWFNRVMAVGVLALIFKPTCSLASCVCVMKYIHLAIYGLSGSQQLLGFQYRNRPRPRPAIFRKDKGERQRKGTDSKGDPPPPLLLLSHARKSPQGRMISSASSSAAAYSDLTAG